MLIFHTFWLVICKLMRIRIRFWIQLITFMRMRMPIQVTKMIRIHNTAKYLFRIHNINSDFSADLVFSIIGWSSNWRPSCRRTSPRPPSQPEATGRHPQRNYQRRASWPLWKTVSTYCIILCFYLQSRTLEFQTFP